MTSVIVRWKNFKTTRTLARVGHLARLSHPARRVLVREVTVALTKLQPLESGRNSLKDDHLSSTPSKTGQNVHKQTTM